MSAPTESPTVTLTVRLQGGGQVVVELQRTASVGAVVAAIEAQQAPHLAVVSLLKFRGRKIDLGANPTLVSLGIKKDSSLYAVVAVGGAPAAQLPAEYRHRKRLAEQRAREKAKDAARRSQAPAVQLLTLTFRFAGRAGSSNMASTRVRDDATIRDVVRQLEAEHRVVVEALKFRGKAICLAKAPLLTLEGVGIRKSANLYAKVTKSAPPYPIAVAQGNAWAHPVDTNGDGVMDGLGLDTTGDGKLDTLGLPIDTVGDGTADSVAIFVDVPPKGLGLDTNGDGKINVWAIAVDTNGDGIADRLAVDTTGDGTPDRFGFAVDTKGGGRRTVSLSI